MQKYDLPPGTGFIKRRVNLAGQDPLYQKIWDECYDPKTGALFFAEHCCYTRKNGIVKYNPRDYQKEMLFLMNNRDSVISLIGRQMGKTVTSCCFILWYAMAFSEKDILITSFGEKSAVENMSKIKSMYEYCPDFLKIPVIKNNETSLVFSNGTRIYCRPTTPKAPRGLSPAIIYCDEFAFVGGNASAQKSLENQQEFYAAISPALSATHGKLFITSTPISETDLFYRLWAGAINKTDDNNLDLPKEYILSVDGRLYEDQNIFKTVEDAKKYIEIQPSEVKTKYKIEPIDPVGNNGFASIFADWTKDPEKTEEWARLQRIRNGEDYFQREFCLRFIGKSKTLINSDTMRKLVDETRDKTYSYIIDDDVRFYKDLDPNQKYLVALDPSMGVKGDFAAMQIFEFPSFTQVGEWMSDELNQNNQVEKLKSVTNWIYEDLRSKGSMRPNIYWTFENNTVGEGFLCALREKALEEGNPERYIQRATLITERGNKRIGWTTDKRNKATACSQLKTRIENGTIRVNSKQYVQQLSNYTLKEVSYSARDGNHDDLISASLLIIMMYLQEMNALDLTRPIEKATGSDKPEEALREWLGDYFTNPFLI